MRHGVHHAPVAQGQNSGGKPHVHTRAIRAIGVEQARGGGGGGGVAASRGGGEQPLAITPHAATAAAAAATAAALSPPNRAWLIHQADGDGGPIPRRRPNARRCVGSQVSVGRGPLLQYGERFKGRGEPPPLLHAPRKRCLQIHGASAARAPRGGEGEAHRGRAMLWVAARKAHRPHLLPGRQAHKAQLPLATARPAARSCCWQARHPQLRRPARAPRKHQPARKGLQALEAQRRAVWHHLHPVSGRGRAKGGHAGAKVCGAAVI